MDTGEYSEGMGVWHEEATLEEYSQLTGMYVRARGSQERSVVTEGGKVSAVLGIPRSVKRQEEPHGQHAGALWTPLSSRPASGHRVGDSSLNGSALGHR